MQSTTRNTNNGYEHTLRLFLLAAAVLGLLAIPMGVQAKADCGTWWVAEAELQLGQAMPDFGFVTCDGSELTTAQLQGKPTLINFWATWCSPCVKELPHFDGLAVELGDEINVVGVSVDKSPQDVRKFLKRKQLSYTLAWDSAGIATDLGFDAIPVTIALDARGRVAAIHRGYASKSELQELLETAQGGS